MLKKKYYTGLQIHEAIDGVVGDYKKAIEIYRRLAKMETDDVQPVKHGKWESNEYLYTTRQTRCSECKTEFYVDDLLNVGEGAQEYLPNYCPHCGAKMERSEDVSTDM